METFSQLCGALATLKQNNIELDWSSLEKLIRDIARRVGIAEFGDPINNTPATGWVDPVHTEVNQLHRIYRDMCLERGLISRGELFNSAECELVFD